MAIWTIDVYAYGFEQGTISGGVPTESSTRVRSVSYIALPSPFLNRKITVSATVSTGKTVQVDIVGFVTTSPPDTFDLCWYNSPYTFNLSSYQTTMYFKVCLKYSDTSNITPSEITSCVATYDDGIIWHAAVGEYPINDNTLPEAPTNYSKPWANWLWRVDEGNDGYPYTELQLGVLHVDPGPTPPPPPPPPPPEEHGIPIVQPDGTHIIDDETSMYYLRYMNGYTNPNLYRFRDGELPENTECDVFIKGTHSHRYTSINDYEDFSTECEIP